MVSAVASMWQALSTLSEVSRNCSQLCLSGLIPKSWLSNRTLNTVDDFRRVWAEEDKEIRGTTGGWARLVEWYMFLWKATTKYICCRLLGTTRELQ